MNNSRISVIIAALLGTALLVGAFWVMNRQRDRNKQDLAALQNELTRLEDRFNAEISNTQDGSFPYPNPDSARVALAKTAEDIRDAKRMIANKPDEVIAKMQVYQANKAEYEKVINEIVAERDRGTGGYIGNLKGELSKAKADLDAALKKNRNMQAQLNRALKQFRGSQNEIKSLKDRLSRLQTTGTDLNDLRVQLDSALADNQRLRQLLAEKDAKIAEQEAMIANMNQKTNTSVAKRIYDFKAQYLFRRTGRDFMVDLNSSSEEHRARRIDEISVTFRAGEQLFEDTEDKILYLTLYKDNQPYRFVRTPVRVSGNSGTQKLDVKSPRLESGSYTIRVFYNEQQVMDDYKFTIR